MNREEFETCSYFSETHEDASEMGSEHESLDQVLFEHVRGVGNVAQLRAMCPVEIVGWIDDDESDAIDHVLTLHGTRQYSFEEVVFILRDEYDMFTERLSLGCGGPKESCELVGCSECGYKEGMAVADA